MTEKTPDQEGNEIPSDPQKEDSKLQEFLQKRQLQIMVLKKMLDQIPIDPESGDPINDEQPKEKP